MRVRIRVLLPKSGKTIFGSSTWLSVFTSGISADGRTGLLRVLAGFQITMILLAVGYAHCPDFIQLCGRQRLSLVGQLASPNAVGALG